MLRDVADHGPALRLLDVAGLVQHLGVDPADIAATAAANGVDTLYNFKPGAGGDTLNFSAFLNKTGTSHLAPVRQDSTANTAWENGDVLVATGNGLDTPEAIAALFKSSASNAPYAQPSAAAKSTLSTTSLTSAALASSTLATTAALEEKLPVCNGLGIDERSEFRNKRDVGAQVFDKPKAAKRS